MMDQSVGIPLPANYESKLPVHAGLLAGVVGALSIMLVVAALLVLSGRDIWTAARLIAVVVYGPDAAEGIAPIVVGTTIHILMGSVLGTIFASVLPCMPRSIWVVAGLMYGIIAWMVSTFIVLPIVAPPMIAADANFNVLLLAHVIYGLILGVAGATYRLWWMLPMTLRTQPDDGNND